MGELWLNIIREECAHIYTQWDSLIVDTDKNMAWTMW